MFLNHLIFKNLIVVLEDLIRCMNYELNNFELYILATLCILLWIAAFRSSDYLLEQKRRGLL